MSGFNGDQRLEFSVVWRDEEMLELKAKLVTEEWRGYGFAYVQFPDLAELGDALQKFAAGSSTPVDFSALQDRLTIRVYEFDAVGHCACHVAIVGDLPSPVNRSMTALLRIDLVTERSFIDRFGREVSRLAQQRQGSAILIFE